MKIENFRPMDLTQKPERDVTACYIADVIDTSGKRYPVHIMIANQDLLAFGAKLDGPWDDAIIEELYRRELKTRLSQLKPENASGSFTTVLFAEKGGEADIVIRNVIEKLRSVARDLGRTLK